MNVQQIMAIVINIVITQLEATIVLAIGDTI